MHLYLIRHGECEDYGKTDADRALTADGAKAVDKMARHVATLPEKPALLFSSPYLRALQTADYFEKTWGLKKQTAPWLVPGSGASEVVEALQSVGEKEAALIGHLPNLGLVLSAFLWGLPPRELVIPRGGVALLKLKSWEAGTAKLEWLLTPDSF
ncbi:MAG: histidine phosphatase family protein [bacterium]